MSPGLNTNSTQLDANSTQHDAARRKLDAASTASTQPRHTQGRLHVWPASSLSSQPRRSSTPRRLDASSTASTPARQPRRMLDSLDTRLAASMHTLSLIGCCHSAILLLEPVSHILRPFCAIRQRYGVLHNSALVSICVFRTCFALFRTLTHQGHYDSPRPTIYTNSIIFATQTCKQTCTQAQGEACHQGQDQTAFSFIL